MWWLCLQVVGFSQWLCVLTVCCRGPFITTAQWKTPPWKSTFGLSSFLSLPSLPFPQPPAASSHWPVSSRFCLEQQGLLGCQRALPPPFPPSPSSLHSPPPPLLFYPPASLLPNVYCCQFITELLYVCEIQLSPVVGWLRLTCWGCLSRCTRTNPMAASKTFLKYNFNFKGLTTYVIRVGAGACSTVRVKFHNAESSLNLWRLSFCFACRIDGAGWDIDFEVLC